MKLYSLVLFVHVGAVLALSATLSFEALSLFRLRRASSLSEAQQSMEPLPGLRWIAISSLVFILVSGIYLAMQMSALGMAWPKVTIAALFLIGPFGAASGRRMRAIRNANATGPAITSELLSRLRDPFLKISLGIRIGVFVGIVLLMAAKPQLWISIGIVGASVVLGLLASFLPGAGRGAAPVATANLTKRNLTKQMK
jgi:hypothetical protein